MAPGADPWERLRAALGEADALERAGDARVGATLALLADLGGDHEIVYTRRRDDLRNHPGQISFPGGRVDPGETVERAALREAAEEVGLDPGTVTVLGALPAFYVPPSRFWLQTVVARWDAPHPLVPEPDEVGEIVRARVSHLADPDRWRAVWLSVSGWTWAWKLDGDHVLWGATAVVTGRLLDRLAPGWSGGASPSDVAADRAVEPWRAPVRSRQRAWLPDAPSRPVEAHPPSWEEPPSPDRLEAVGAAVAGIADRLGAGRVVVLAGAGGNGLAGLAAAQRMARDGRDVEVVCDRPLPDLPEPSRELLGGLAAEGFSGDLPRADLYVDALVGGGLEGSLRGGAREVMLALRRRDTPVVAIDVPSGMSGEAGLVAESVTARISLALGGPRPGLLAPGIEPFAGDLYVVDERGALTRVLREADRGGEKAGWRE